MTSKPHAERAIAALHRSSRRAFFGLALSGLSVLAGFEAVSAKPKRRQVSKLKAGAKRGKKSKQRARRPKFKTVTRTFSNATPITIPDNTDPVTPYPSEIKVKGLRRGRLLDVNVTLHNFSHTYPDDVDVMLESPNSRRAVIMSDVGSSFDVSNLTIKLDDQAAALLPPNTQLGSGTFRPTNDGLVDNFPAPAVPSSDVALSTFKGINPNGSWRLYVADDVGADGGSIAGGWSLTIKARVRVS